MKKTLIISTVLPFTEIALVEGKKTHYYAGWQSDYNEAEKLLVHLRTIIGLKQGYDQIIVAAGPGGFTGLRVGVTMANTLAYAGKTEISAVGTRKLLEAKIPDKLRGKTYLMLRSELKKKNGKIRIPAKYGFATGDLTTEQIQTCLPASVKWLDLKDLKPVYKAIGAAGAFSKRSVKPVYPAPPQITKSAKPVFR